MGIKKFSRNSWGKIPSRTVFSDIEPREFLGKGHSLPSHLHVTIDQETAYGYCERCQRVIKINHNGTRMIVSGSALDNFCTNKPTKAHQRVHKVVIQIKEKKVVLA